MNPIPSPLKLILPRENVLIEIVDGLGEIVPDAINVVAVVVPPINLVIPPAVQLVGPPIVDLGNLSEVLDFCGPTLWSSP